MKSRRLLLLAVGTCLLFALSPAVGLAQTGAPGGGGPGGGAPGGGAPGGSGTPGSTTTTQTKTAVTVQTVTSGTGSATGIPSNSNPFVSTYGDYMSWGNPTKYATTFGPLAKPTVTFGKGIYTTTATTTSSAAAAAATQANGFTTTGIVRNPQYSTVLSDEIPMVIHTAEKLQADLRAVIDRSSYVKNKGAIQINISENAVHLVGQVATEKEYRLVEGMVRTTPGVSGYRDVKNELRIVPVIVSGQ
jgi:osmotically-inducible protein OsmY